MVSSSASDRRTAVDKVSPACVRRTPWGRLAEEAYSQVALKRFDLLAHGCWCDLKLVGCSAESLVSCRRFEHDEGAE